MKMLLNIIIIKNLIVNQGQTLLNIDINIYLNIDINYISI